jgi:hypothetical protein
MTDKSQTDEFQAPGTLSFTAEKGADELVNRLIVEAHRLLDLRSPAAMRNHSNKVRVLESAYTLAKTATIPDYVVDEDSLKVREQVLLRIASMLMVLKRVLASAEEEAPKGTKAALPEQPTATILQFPKSGEETAAGDY